MCGISSLLEVLSHGSSVIPWEEKEGYEIRNTMMSDADQAVITQWEPLGACC